MPDSPATIMLAALLAAILPATPALAWERHDLLTRQILRDARWLDSYRNLEVDDPPPDDSPYNPSYQPVYLDHMPGERESAREILVRYVDEPDWGMDTGLDLSPLQGLAGGSAGFRHQYYFYAAGALPVGDAPNRMVHFYQLAVAQMKAGHPYWAFRELARSLHFLEDMGQPLHTQPFLYSWLVRTHLSSAKTSTLATNLHYAYEGFVHWHLSEEIRQDRGPLLLCLRNPPRLSFFDPKTAVRALAEFSHGRANPLLSALDAFFPARIKSTSKVVLPTPQEFKPTSLRPSYYQILSITADCLRITAGTVRSVMGMAERDFASAKRKSLDSPNLP